MFVHRRDPASTYSQADHARFIEQNTLFPEASRVATTNYRSLEQNALPGDAVTASVRSSADILFPEQNLPQTVAPETRSAAEITRWEQNTLPGDDLPVLPLYSVNGETIY
jgi:hypothetical protein